MRIAPVCAVASPQVISLTDTELFIAADMAPGPIGGCFICGGAHYRSECPEAEFDEMAGHAGKAKGKGKGKEKGGKDKGKGKGVDGKNTVALPAGNGHVGQAKAGKKGDHKGGAGGKNGGGKGGHNAATTRCWLCSCGRVVLPPRDTPPGTDASHCSDQRCKKPFADGSSGYCNMDGVKFTLAQTQIYEETVGDKAEKNNARNKAKKERRNKAKEERAGGKPEDVHGDPELTEW